MSATVSLTYLSGGLVFSSHHFFVPHIEAHTIKGSLGQEVEIFFVGSEMITCGRLLCESLFSDAATLYDC